MCLPDDVLWTVVLLFAHHLLWIILCLARVLFGPCCLPEMIHLLFHFTHRSVGACLFIPFGRLGLPLTFVLVCGPFWSDISLVYSLILLACLRHHDFLGVVSLCIPSSCMPCILHLLDLRRLPLHGFTDFCPCPCVSQSCTGIDSRWIVCLLSEKLGGDYVSRYHGAMEYGLIGFRGLVLWL